MKKTIAILFALLLAFPCTAVMNKAKPSGKPDRVLKKGEWEFQIFYRAKGSRSEGQHGVLLHKGVALPPGKKKEEKESPLGTMVYYGDDYQAPWETTGWNFKDKSKILTSWDKETPTMAALEAQFADKVVGLSQSNNMSSHMMEQEILNAAASVFSDHPNVIAQETEKRLAELSTYDRADLPSDASHQDFDLSVLSVPQIKKFLIVFGWQPKRVAQTAKAAVLSRQMDVQKYGCRALLEAALPDKYYRLAGTQKPTIVIESLGDFFLVECKKLEWGVLMPEKMRWFKKKVSPTQL